MRVFKVVGYLVGTIVGLLVLAVAGVYLVTGIRMAKQYDVAAVPVPVPADSAGLARGRHLAGPIGKCTECHGADLSGKMIFDDPAMGRLWATNLTRGSGGIGSRYDDPLLARAIRHGINEAGKPLRFMPSEAFQYMSDEDVGALVAYLRSLPPVDRAIPKGRIGPVARALSLFTAIPLISPRAVDHARVPPVSVREELTPAYGRYLADVGGCTGCHGPGLSGGSLGPGKPAANLTPAGIGSWTEADFFRALREGQGPGGVVLDSVAMPWRLAGQMSDLEIQAVWAYLKTVPGKPFGGR